MRIMVYEIRCLVHLGKQVVFSRVLSVYARVLESGGVKMFVFSVQKHWRVSQNVSRRRHLEEKKGQAS